MKNNFLKFHEFKTNSVVYIDSTEIGIISTETSNSSRNVSKLHFFNTTNVISVYVNETPEKIYANCKLDNFIRLHVYPSNNTVLVNINSVSVLDSIDLNGSSCTKIFFKNSINIKPFTVYESPDKIYKMLSDNEQNKP